MSELENAIRNLQVTARHDQWSDDDLVARIAVILGKYFDATKLAAALNEGTN